MKLQILQDHVDASMLPIRGAASRAIVGNMRSVSEKEARVMKND